MSKIFSFLILFFLCSSLYSQNTEIELKVKDIALQEVFSLIEENSDYTFLYFHKDVKSIVIDSLSVRTDDINKILDLLLKGRGLSYHLKDNVVIISKADKERQEDKIYSKYIITGIVTDERMSPLVGATVIEKGSVKGVVTDINGRYRLPVGGKTEIIYSYVGKKSRSVVVYKDTVLNILMKDEVYGINEIFITGYESEKKKNIAGSVVHIGGDEIEKIPVESFQKSMQGRVAGVKFIPETGVPGGAVSVRIRGYGTLNASNSPLYIIDGIQLTNYSTNRIISSQNPLAGIRNEDILSVDILKDGATASIYGAQAANGVIIVTTKKGHRGKPKLNFNSSFGVSEVVKKIDLLNGPEWAELTLLNYKNRYGINSKEYKTELDRFRKKGWGEDGYSNAPTTDWQDAVFRKAFSKKYGVSLSGGNATSRYFTSFGYEDTEGVIINSDFNKYSFRLNYENEIVQNVYMTTNINYNSFSQKGVLDEATYGNPNRTAMLMVPTNPVYNEDGSYFQDFVGTYNDNVVMSTELNMMRASVNRFMGTVTLKADITSNISIKSSFGYDYSDMLEKMFMDPRTIDGKVVNGRIVVADSRRRNIQTEHLISYSSNKKNRNRISALLGVSYRKNVIKLNSATGSGVNSPDFKLLSQTANTEDAEERYFENRFAGIFSKLKYAYDDRYIINATLRYDGSSRFGANNMYGFFPSLSGVWRLSSEDIMKKIDWIDDFKIKLGYGVTGNSNIGDYSNKHLFAGKGDYLNEAGIAPDSEYGNKNIKWEENHTLNFGVDISLFNERFNIEADIFKRRTKNLLLARELPKTSGYDVMWENVGEIVNKGVEVVVDTRNVSNNEFVWTSSLNIAFNDNEITKLFAGVDKIGNRYKVGESAGSVYTYKYAGADPDNGLPQWYDRNYNKVYKPTPEDRFWLDSFLPDVYGGLLNNFKIGRFDVSFLFDFQYGGFVYNVNRAFLVRAGATADRNQLQEMYDDYWKKPGDKTWVPKPVYNGVYEGEDVKSFYSVSDVWFEKTDYIKLRSFAVSYHLPERLLNRIKIEDLSLFAEGGNLWTISDYSGYDPEFTNEDNGIYPPSKTITLGIRLSL